MTNIPNKLSSSSDLFARRLRVARRVYSKEGGRALIGELSYQFAKPWLSAHDWIRWRWLRARGKKTFDVLGHQITILPRDPGVSRELAVHRVHEPLATRLLLDTLKPGMNVVDIGSNIGYYALLEARLIGPQGIVFAIEPMAENAQQLAANIRANGYENVRIHKLGIANRNGSAEMNVSAKSNWHTLNSVPWPTKKRRVPVSTLDDLLRKHAPSRVDLVRMDLEGYEVVVIKGMRWTLHKYEPRLLVELHPHLVGPESIIEYLKSLEEIGYGVEWMIEQERDVALRWRFMKVERPNMQELMADPRISQDPRSLTVLLATNLHDRSRAEARIVRGASASALSFRQVGNSARHPVPRNVDSSAD